MMPSDTNMGITIAGYTLNIETAKFITGILLELLGILVQVLLALGAWMVALRIHQGTVSKQNEDLRLRLYDRRYKLFDASTMFLSAALIKEEFAQTDLIAFDVGTCEALFLFGPDIADYLKQIRDRACKMKLARKLPDQQGTAQVQFDWLYGQFEPMSKLFYPYFAFSHIK